MKSEVGFGITETGTTIESPRQPLFVGVIVKLTTLLGQTVLESGVFIELPIVKPVPDWPSEDVQLKVVPATLEFRLMMFEFPGEQILGDALVAVTVGLGVTFTVTTSVAIHPLPLFAVRV